jgi:putative transposase
VVLELLSDEQTLNQIASKYEVLPKSLADWKKQFLENATLAFEPAKATKEYKDEIKAKDVEIEELQKALGKTTIERDWAVKKLKSLGLLNKKSLVEPKLTTLSLTRQCDLIGIHRSSLYYKPKEFSTHNIGIMHRIDEIFTEMPFYGHRRIHRQLIDEEIAIGRHRVARYMKVLGIKALYPTKKHNTSMRNKEHAIYPYLLKKAEITQPNQVWCGDITYIRLQGGFAYLSVVMDWYSKKVLSWKLDTTMDASLSSSVLKQAIEHHGRPDIFNSDQGSQYTAYEHISVLKKHGINISMNGKGRSIDNIVAERFFRSLKYEDVYLKRYSTLREAKKGIENYIRLYNTKRLHSALDYKTPLSVYMKKMDQAA